MATLNYYRERHRRKGRLIGILGRAQDSDHFVTVAICDRRGEETKVHREGVISRYRLTDLYEEVERIGKCCCVGEFGVSTYAEMNGADEPGDCFDHHKVFVCGKCGRVAPWCLGGDYDDKWDPDGDLCSECAVEIMDEIEAQEKRAQQPKYGPAVTYDNKKE
jgi:hypothetical protein